MEGVKLVGLPVTIIEEGLYTGFSEGALLLRNSLGDDGNEVVATLA